MRPNCSGLAPRSYGKGTERAETRFEVHLVPVGHISGVDGETVYALLAPALERCAAPLARDEMDFMTSRGEALGKLVRTGRPHARWRTEVLMEIDYSQVPLPVVWWYPASRQPISA